MESEEEPFARSYKPWEHEDYGTLKMTMSDLEQFITKSMIETSKLDACLDIFVEEIKEIPTVDLDKLPHSGPDGVKSDPKVQRASITLAKNIGRLIPGYLNDPSGSGILDDEKLIRALERRLEDRDLHAVSSKSHFGQGPHSAAHKSLVDTIVSKLSRQSSEELRKAEPAPLGQVAFERACQQLTEFISGQKASATFACGGTVSIGEQLPPGTSNISPPVRLSWTAKDVSGEHKLVFPVNPTDAADAEQVLKLLSDCDIASFGKGDKDVVDPEYRKAGKLDPSRFLTSFHPANFNILDDVEQLLAPNFQSVVENMLPFRKLKAELYKLNVYSGPDGLFRSHVDTPRSTNQIGSLVVCLPSAFKGGDLIVRHQGSNVSFDWSTRSDSTIQWAAFYSDCAHEIKPVTDGHRITLTYNLYVTDSGCGSVPRNVNIDPQTLPLHGLLKSLLAEPGFMKQGGILGVNCSHAYPHASSQAQGLLPKGLKGADLAVYSVFKSLGIDVHVLPVLRQKHDDSLESDAVEYMLKYLRDGEEFEPIFVQVPRHIPIEEDVEKYWKMLYVSRRLHGMRKIVQFAKEKRLDMDPTMFQDTKGNYLGTKLHGFSVYSDPSEEDEPIAAILDRLWPAQFIPGITWISQPLHREMAFTHLAYGNEYTVETVYSCATILAAVPAFDQRQTTLG